MHQLVCFMSMLCTRTHTYHAEPAYILCRMVHDLAVELCVSECLCVLCVFWLYVFMLGDLALYAMPSRAKQCVLRNPNTISDLASVFVCARFHRKKGKGKSHHLMNNALFEIYIYIYIYKCRCNFAPSDSKWAGNCIHLFK